VERYTTMTLYQEDWNYPVAFAPEHPSMTLPKAVAQCGVRQLHVAETEKYAHVTYFFSCGQEERFEASAASSCPPRATSRPTTTSPR
jgi:2,3-bisphosphoglycerate-independent phosphoglycerate mutase